MPDAKVDDPATTGIGKPKKPRAKGKGKPKPKVQAQASSERPDELKARDRALKRFRHNLEKSKKSVKKEWARTADKDKEKWRTQFAASGDFDFVKDIKTERRSHKKSKSTKGVWMTEDKLLATEGWTADNAESEVGQRAFRRATLTMDMCKKIGKKFIKKHPQHGERLYKRLEMEESDVKNREQALQTLLEKQADVDDAVGQEGIPEESGSSGSSDADDSDNDSDSESASSKPSKKKRSTCVDQEEIQRRTEALGKCVSLESQMKGFDWKKFNWLSSWSKQITESTSKLAGAKDCIVAALNGAARTPEYEEATKTISIAEHLVGVITPVHRTMLEATQKLNAAQD